MLLQCNNNIGSVPAKPEPNSYDKLIKLDQLYKKGIITEAECKKHKAKFLEL